MGVSSVDAMRRGTTVSMTASLSGDAPSVQSIDRIGSIHMMNLVSVDLNLLVALEALIAEAHVGRAAGRIGRSQPALSHALMRLRDLLGDPLLVRIGSRMELTPRALALKESLPDALERVRSLLATESFDPATSARHFCMSCSLDDLPGFDRSPLFTDTE